MTEELKSALAALIDGVVQAGDFVVANAPEVVRQLLAWEFVISIIWALVWFSISAGLLLCGQAVKRFRDSDKCRSQDDAMGCLILLRVCAGLLAIPGIAYVANAIKVQVAPAVYLLEYAAKLVQVAT